MNYLLTWRVGEDFATKVVSCRITVFILHARVIIAINPRQAFPLNLIAFLVGLSTTIEGCDVCPFICRCSRVRSAMIASINSSGISLPESLCNSKRRNLGKLHVTVRSSIMLLQPHDACR